MTYDATDADVPMMRLSDSDKRAMERAELAKRHSDELVARLLAKGYLTMTAT